MKKWAAGILLIVLMCCSLWGCSIEKVRAKDGVKPEYTVMKEEDFPDKVRELVEQNREKEFQMTYQDSGFLYLMKGYGKQETGGYSIQVQDLSLWDNDIHLETMLLEPEEGEELTGEPSFPCLVIKMKYREEPVIFE